MNQNRKYNDHVAGKLWLALIIMGLGMLCLLIYYLVTSELPKNFPKPK